MFPIGAWVWLGILILAILIVCSYKIMPKIGNKIIDKCEDIKHTIQGEDKNE